MPPLLLLLVVQVRDSKFSVQWWLPIHTGDGWTLETPLCNSESQEDGGLRTSTNQVTIIRQSWHDVVISVPGSGSRPNNCGVELAVPLWRASGSSYKLYHAVTSNLYASITWWYGMVVDGSTLVVSDSIGRLSLYRGFHKGSRGLIQSATYSMSWWLLLWPLPLHATPAREVM